MGNPTYPPLARLLSKCLCGEGHASVPEKLVTIVMDEAVNHLDAPQRGTAAKIDEDGVAE